MSAYAAVDGIIAQWMSENDLFLNTQFGGVERRFCYVTGSPQECFQISIEPPEGKDILINVWSVETIDDADLHECWAVNPDHLHNALDLALRQIRSWEARLKEPATWSIGSA